MDNQLCAQCGIQLEADSSSGDFCPECAAKIRSELALAFQLKRVWIWLRDRSAHLPLVTLLLVAINVAVYCYIAANSPSGGRNLETFLEMHGARVIQGEWWRLLTSAFLHLNVFHLISNAIFLCFLGWASESVFGHAKLLLLWLTSGIAGSIAGLFYRQPPSISFGASGVVYGLIAALACVYFRSGILPTKKRYLRIILLATLAGTGIFGDWYAFGRLNPGHIGGLLAGFLFPLLITVAPTASRKRLVIGLAGILLLLSATTLLAIRRQKVWLELDELDPSGTFMVNWGSIPRLQQIVAERPDILRAHELLAEAYQSGHRYDDAIREYHYILGKRPLSERAWYRMGWAFMNIGRFGDAIDAFSQTLKIDSRNSTGQTDDEPMLKVRMDREALANAYEGAGRTDESAAEYKLILQIYPDDYIAKRELTRLEKLIHTSNSGNGAKHASKHLDERSTPD